MLDPPTSSFSEPSMCTKPSPDVQDKPVHDTIEEIITEVEAHERTPVAVVAGGRPEDQFVQPRTVDEF